MCNNIETLIINSLNKSNIFFPSNTRYSEQELKEIFINKVNHDTKINHYSVETPTLKKYSFSKTENNENNDIDEEKNDKSNDTDFPQIKGDATVARIDTTLYYEIDEKKEKGKYSHIEFKYGNPVIHDFAKDLLKLVVEQKKIEQSINKENIIFSNNKNYFIFYSYESEKNKASLDDILKKFAIATAYVKTYIHDYYLQILQYSNNPIENALQNVVVYLMINSQKYKFYLSSVKLKKDSDSKQKPNFPVPYIENDSWCKKIDNVNFPLSLTYEEIKDGEQQ